MPNIPIMDKRYTINLEFCGYSTKKYVLRFCNEYINNYIYYNSAYKAYIKHNENRF